MRSKLMERLNILEHRLGVEQRVLLMTYDTDSQSHRDELVERWKSGEKVDEIRSQKPYQGGELVVMNVVFVTGPRSEAAKEHW